MQKKIFLISIFFFLNINSTDQYYCTASDAKFYNHLLNLIGSIHHTNFDNLKEIAVFNLGLNQNQITNLNSLEKVKVYEIEKTNPDILKIFKTHKLGKFVPGWYAWKPVAIKQALDMFPYVLWIDAGLAVLRPMNEFFEYIKQNGYFLCTGGDAMKNNKYQHSVKWQTTKYLIDKFKLNLPERKWIFEQEALLAGFVGVSRKQISKFILPLYEFTKDLKMFEDDGSTPGGFGSGRHDQSILTILAYLNGLKINRQDTKQENPILLTINNQDVPFYINWNPENLSKNTHVYISAKLDYRTIFTFMLVPKKKQNNTNIPNKKILNFMYPKDNDWSLSKNFLQKIKELFNPEMFIETGTMFGNTCAKAAEIFEKVYSIELDKSLYDNAINKFKINENVHICFGDSKKVLQSLLPSLKNKKILFFLDAHWSSDLGARGEENTPILAELKAIKDADIKNAIIIIDDIRFFQDKDIVEKYMKNQPNDPSSIDYPTFENLQKSILDIDQNYKIVVYGDMAIAYLNGENIFTSPIIDEMTSSKILKKNNILNYLNVISKAEGLEKEGIASLLKINDPQFFTIHYKLWNILILFNEGKITEAKELLEKIENLGFINSNIDHLIKIIKNIYL